MPARSLQHTLLVCFLIAALSPTTAHAADECKDVLVNAVMNTLKVDKDNYYNTAILSTIDERSDSQQDTSAGLGVVIEGIPIQLTYADAKRLKTSISKYYSLNAIARERSSYLLMSGQEAIIGAWRDCMSKRGGGLSLRFKPLDGKAGHQTLLLVEYYKPSEPTSKALNIELMSDVYIDEKAVEIKAGAECLKAGKVYKAGDACTVLLITPSAWTTMPVVMLTKTQGDDASTLSYSAYLGPRAELVGSSQPYGPKVTTRTYAFDHGTISPIECFDASEGYYLLEKSIKITSRPEGGATRDTCIAKPDANKKEFIFDESGKRICVQQINATPDKVDRYCSLAITGTEATVKWDPPPPIDNQ